MPNYKNNSKFPKPFSLNGQRVLLQPNQTFTSNKPIDISIYDFLTEDESTNGNQVVIPIKQNVVASIDDFNKLKSEVETVKNNLQNDEKVLKRLDILKEAVQNIDKRILDIENTVRQLVEDVYNNGHFIVTELDEEPEQTNKKEK